MMASSAKRRSAPEEAPIYRRIQDELCSRIASGAYRVGGPLPTDADLMREFGVSRHSVRAAVSYLVTKQLVRRFRGKGSVVVGKPHANDDWAVSSIEDVIAYSFHDALAVIGIVTPGAAEQDQVAEALRCRPGTSFLRLDATRSSEAGPYTFSNIYLPEDIAARLPLSALGNPGNVPIVRLIHEHCGLIVGRARQVSTAVAADREVAQRLDLVVGAPVLVLERTWFTADGVGIEHVRIHCHPERYRQVVEFRRAPHEAPSAPDNDPLSMEFVR